MLSKEHYCYKILTLLLKICAYPPPSFLQGNIDPPVCDFSKISPPPYKSLSIPLLYITKPQVSLGFLGVKKEISDIAWFNASSNFNIPIFRATPLLLEQRAHSW